MKKWLALAATAVLGASLLISGCGSSTNDASSSSAGSSKACLLYTSEALRLIVHDLDLTTNLTELGLTKKDIPWLVDNVYVVATGNIANTVADVSREDIEMLYKKMF